MDAETHPVCTHVSEGEEEEELFKNLKALDPCGKFDDIVFSQRVQNFSKQYEEKICETIVETGITVKDNIDPPENQETVSMARNPL